MYFFYFSIYFSFSSTCFVGEEIYIIFFFFFFCKKCVRAVIFKNRKSISDICFMTNTIGQMVLTTILRQGTISFAFKISRPFHIKVLNWLLHMNNICFEIPKFMSMGRWVTNLVSNFTHIIWWRQSEIKDEWTAESTSSRPVLRIQSNI